jgi:hypothetical protein
VQGVEILVEIFEIFCGCGNEEGGRRGDRGE